MAKLVLLIALVQLVGPPVADAKTRHQPRTTNPVALAVRLGERYWGATPCHEALQVTSSEEMPAEVSGAAINGKLQQGASVLLAWTSFDTPDGWDRIDDSPRVFFHCTITLNAMVWRDWRIDDGNFQWLCDAITHELGHLFGHADEGQTDPASIEYPELEPGSPNYDAVPECRHVFLRYGHERILGE